MTKITISDDISFNVFSLVLEFLYTGKIQLGNHTMGGGVEWRDGEGGGREGLIYLL